MEIGRSRALLAALCASLTLVTQPATAAPARCAATSASGQNSLVELFTSDGCSSCPPANAWLSAVLARADAAIIPVSLHVTYWNDLGWRDPHSDGFFDQRQAWYAQRASNRFSYTPEMFLDGREWSGWRSGAAAHPPVPARAAVKLALDLAHGESGTFLAQVELKDARADILDHLADHQLMVYFYQDGLIEHPDAGELRGVQLRHDHVVLAWKTIDHPRLAQAYALRFIPHLQATAGRVGVIALLQDRGSGAVLQAIDLPDCH